MQPTPLPALPATQIAQNGPYTLSAIHDFHKDDALFIPTFVRHPKTGQEFACFSLSRGGFLLIDPDTGEKRQIRPQGKKPFSTAWRVAQGPEGDLYQVDFIPGTSMVTRWDWTTPESQIVAQSPSTSPFDYKASADGHLYITEYRKNHIIHVDTRANKSRILADLKGIGHHVRHLFLGNDGMLYAKTISYADQPNPGNYLAMVDPATGQITDLTPADRAPFQLEVSADNKILYATQTYGRSVWQELIRGKFHPIDQSNLRITSTASSLVFSDGSYIESYREWECTLVSPDGSKKTLDITPEGTPVRIFSVGAATGKIWAGTFIPLRLAAFDPAAHTTTPYGNPTPVTGEIYALSGNDKTLYFSSYTTCWITRLTPSLPINKDDSVLSNPGQLGKIKPQGLPLQRTYGVTQDPTGRIFFAALGGYGCPDSGIARIDPANSDQLTTWTYPQTTFGAMCHLSSINRLLVSEYRRNETSSARFTLIDPDTGAIEWSLPMLQDAQNIVSWLPAPDGNSAIGVYAYRATLLKFDALTRSITHSLPEVRVGTHCHNALIQGLDGQVWGYTGTQVYKTDWNLSKIETLFDFSATADPNHYRFGFCKGPDNRLYFPDGTRLLRIEQSPNQ